MKAYLHSAGFMEFPPDWAAYLLLFIFTNIANRLVHTSRGKRYRHNGLFRKIIKESYHNLKHKLGRVPSLIDFYENGEVDPILIQPDRSTVITVQAHSGRTDGNGGHKDNKNKSGLGSYHYHCGGHPAHLHTNGVCPYASSANDTASSQTDSSQSAASSSSSGNSVSKSTTTSSDLTKSEIKKVQQKLNDLGYDCGTPDGILGKNTKKALKAFQKDNGIKESGTIDQSTKEKLEL